MCIKFWFSIDISKEIRMGQALEIFYDHGIRIKSNENSVSLDPRRKNPNPIVSHGHTDHLAKDALMTHPTKDIMKVRKNWDASLSVDYNQPVKIDGFDVVLKDAGHVLGSAMVFVDDILYTGDFNPEGGLTCGKAIPQKCKTLIVEATYGKRQYSLPNKEEIEADMFAWMNSIIENNSVIIGGYEFGKAQELIALCNKKLDREVYIPQSMAPLCDVYIKHGIDLKYNLLKENWFEEKSEPRIIVVTPSLLQYRNSNYWQVHKERKRGTKVCYVSGWCAFHPRSDMGLDSKFPLSDHADFDDIIEFVSKCSPGKVYTVNGSTEELAREITKETGIEADPLN